MYRSRHFDISDRAEALALAGRRVAGTLVVAGEVGFEASMIPWVVDEDVLRGHVARPNPLVDLLRSPQAGLVVFDVVDGYVSPSWYPSKAEHHRVVPTWNYEAVHVHGSVRAIDDADWLRSQIEALTTRLEAGRPAPWSPSEAPEEFVSQLIRGIVGIEVVIDRVEGKAKLSQNRSAADVAGVLAGLSHEPPALSLLDEMRRVARPAE